MNYVEEPLSFYVGKLQRGEPFTSLIYGDGELCVILGRQTGKVYTGYKELVTPKMVQELRESLYDPDPSIFRGTDFNVLNSKYWDSGRLEKPLEELLGPAHERLTWHNGVVWEDALRAGDFAPVLRALHGKTITMIGGDKLREFKHLHPTMWVAVPPENAYAHIDEMERIVLGTANREVYIMCIGLGATALIMRLRRKLPKATFLDMGSLFDLFVSGSNYRAWRQELEAEPERLKEIIRRNLEGVCTCC